MVNRTEPSGKAVDMQGAWHYINRSHGNYRLMIPIRFTVTLLATLQLDYYKLSRKIQSVMWLDVTWNNQGMILDPSKPALGSTSSCHVGTSPFRSGNCFTTNRIFPTQSNERTTITCKCAVKLSTRKRFYNYNSRLQGMGFDILSYEDTKIVG